MKMMASLFFSRVSVHVFIFSMILGITSATSAHAQTGDEEVTVGSKKFTESVILSEMIRLALASSGYTAGHLKELGGTRFVWNALLANRIDIYPEYTGTLIQEIFAGESLESEQALREALARNGIQMTEPLGFNNTYALGMKKDKADALGITTISDLRQHPDLRFGFSNEFLDREDGWPGLRQRYNLPHRRISGMDHDLSYRGIESGTVDVTDLYSTDAEISYYDLRVLEDDLGFFPEYHAVLLYRDDLPSEMIRVLRTFEGSISEQDMIILNARAKIDRVPETEVAAQFLNDNFDLDEPVLADTQSTWTHLRIWTFQHLRLVLISLTLAILVAIPLGIIAAKFDRIGQVILSIVGIIYTIPSLALLVFMIPFLGIGGPPAIVALFLYSLLPIVRNTHTGLIGISGDLIESAKALGLSAGARLWHIELPLASPSILAGIKTSAIINVGTATLGALIGAGGYGQPILTGIRLDDVGLILQGAVPAALLALLVQGLFEIAERFLVPRGLRI